MLFKPTKASEVPIRHDYDQAVSYFVGAAAAGDDIGIKEDKGFAINPWTVRGGVEMLASAPHDTRLKRAPLLKSMHHIDMSDPHGNFLKVQQVESIQKRVNLEV